MKIAMPCTRSDEIFEHFGHASEFVIYEHNGGDYVDKKFIQTRCSGHDETARLMRYLEINMVVCGGIGQGAIDALTKYGILVYAGVEGSTDRAYYDLMENRLKCTSKPSCKSHDCSCGSGGCSCGCCG